MNKNRRPEPYLQVALSFQERRLGRFIAGQLHYLAGRNVFPAGNAQRHMIECAAVYFVFIALR